MAHLSTLYDQDFHAWALQSAELIRTGQLEQLDLEHLAEEVEDMGANKQQQLENRLRILLSHLLKWRYQPHLRSRSWEATIKEQRYSIQRLMQKNPSLKNKWDETLTDAYRLGVLLAVRETYLEETTFPSECPYTTEQIVSDDYWPG